MAEELLMPVSADKKEKYEALLPQIEALMTGEDNTIANLANIAAALKYGMDFFWVGFYIVEGDTLVLGPFQGPIACTRIPKGKGVCGKSFADAKTVLVPDVDAFPGHIACSSDSRSEIVVPVIQNGTVKMILDVDSKAVNDFDAIDQHYLEQLMAMLASDLSQ